jgi:ATP-dependent Lhr-like helicase
MEIRYGNNRKLGHVEEYFVGRMRPGDHFTFGGQVLEFLGIRQNIAWVRRSTASKGTIPRWTGGRMPLSAELSASVREALAEARGEIYRSPEMTAVRELLELQQSWSRIPGTDEVLIEQIQTREGHHIFIYPFEGRLVHEGLAALVAYRLSRAQPLTLTLSMNDYGFELLSAVEADFENHLGELFAEERLLDDIRSSLNSVEMAKRQFREVARVAGLVFEGYPGRRKPGREAQVSSGLLFDVFRKYEPDNLLVRQAEREVLESQLEQSRLKDALCRLRRSRIVLTRPPSPTPFAFPLMVDRLREQLTSESFEHRIRRMVVQLEDFAARPRPG